MAAVVFRTEDHDAVAGLGHFGNLSGSIHTHILYNMPKPNKLHTWRITRIIGTPAADIGTVEAPDAETAIKEASRNTRSRTRSNRRGWSLGEATSPSADAHPLRGFWLFPRASRNPSQSAASFVLIARRSFAPQGSALLRREPANAWDRW
jgi:hypothetical protein